MNKTLILGACVASLFAISASAIPAVDQLVPDGTTVFDTYYISKNGTGPGNGNDSGSNLYRLLNYFIPDVDCENWESYKPSDQDSDQSGLTDWDYAVVHYGNAGAGSGGGGVIGAFALNGNDTFDFGDPREGYSSVDLYRCKGDQTSVPDGGASIILLGLGMLGLDRLRRILVKD